MTVTKLETAPMYTIEVLDESIRIVYIFRGVTAAHTEKLVNRCFFGGEQTWWDTRAATPADSFTVSEFVALAS